MEWFIAVSSVAISFGSDGEFAVDVCVYIRARLFFHVGAYSGAWPLTLGSRLSVSCDGQYPGERVVPGTTCWHHRNLNGNGGLNVRPF